MLTFYNAIANNGKMMKPMFVKEILSGGQPEIVNEPTVLNDKICSKSTLDKVKDCLESVVSHGTARSLSKSTFQIAGKTGTAQINYTDRNRSRMEYRASFIGYFPADDPKYTCVVIVSNPTKNRQYGAEVAAPVFKEIADKVYATCLDIKDNQPNITTGAPAIATSKSDDIRTILAYLNCPMTDNKDYEDYDYWSVYNNNNKIGVRGRAFRNNQIPNVVGMNAKDAAYILEKMGLQVRFNGIGRIVEQSIAPGTKYGGNETIWLRLST
jgi:cell division protein FtsI (penicillin-binding protein 3)